MASVDAIAALKGILNTSPPICSGTSPLPSGQNILAYGLEDDGSARWVDLATATPEQIDAVSAACHRATFGRNGEDILDETYRKAGQLSAKDFSIGFNLDKSGILDSVYAQLLEGFNSPDKRIDAELYKLNIYDKGSFFKAHQDTPRGQNMFGSLVIVFPTFHVGGALLLRHDNKERVFDSSQLLAPFDGSKIAYVAFYGDVEHEVAVVESGHRVTLTYNLYFTQGSASQVSPSTERAHDLRSALSELLSDVTFLPEGGTLGFGLRYKYPVDDDTDLSEMESSLKGADALLIRVCQDLQLETSLKAVYDTSDGAVIFDQVLDTSNEWRQVEGSVIPLLVESYHGEVIELNDDSEFYGHSKPEVTDIAWVTQMSNLISLHAPYINYGNEASLKYLYGDLALMVTVPGNR
ncbi:hypothetical protein FB451DRAFT_1549351 [Mycena latifolia]|nr:hypothetical protein FB451DRAFT_1549351 [Mycena latifolia]